MRRNCLTVAVNTGQRELVEEVVKADLIHPDQELSSLLAWAGERLRRKEP
jgi:hypothetical protein